MKCVRNIISIVAIILASASLQAANEVELKGEYTYYDDGRHSKVECMQIAAENARIDALAHKFGTLISQSMMQTDRVMGKRESNDFLALSQSQVKGEWLGDSEQPSYSFSTDKDGNLVVTCKVKGTAREITNEATEFEALLLKNGTNRKNADTHFHNGDDMYLLFNASCAGHLRIYLEDESRTVYELLPYPNDAKNVVKTRPGREYIFFNRALGKEEFGPEEELTLTAPNGVEYNRIYAIFSPNPFSGPVTTDTATLRAINSKDFTKWLLKARTNDSKMNVKTMNIEILPDD